MKAIILDFVQFWLPILGICGGGFIFLYKKINGRPTRTEFQNYHKMVRDELTEIRYDIRLILKNILESKK